VAPETNRGGPSLEPKDYLTILRRRWLIIAIVTAIVLGVALYHESRLSKVYEASGAFVVTAGGDGISDAATEAKIAESSAVHAFALKSAPQIGTVETSVDPGDSLVTVTGQSGIPAEAANTVNAHLTAYLDYTRQTQSDRYIAAQAALAPTIQDLQNQINALNPAAAQAAATGISSPASEQRQNLVNQQQALKDKLQSIQIDTTLAGQSATIVTTATAPSSPISPKPLQDGLIALGAGLLLGIALAFILELLDDSIKTREDLQQALGDEVPVLGVIPRMRTLRPEIVSLQKPASITAEAYRQLRTAVYFVGIDRGGCFEVTSAKGKEGKTLTATNLAVAAARAGRRVYLVDCDLRQPAVHKYLGLPNDSGFTSVLLGTPVSRAGQSIPGVENLTVLTSGPLPPNPSELLGGDRCREVLRSLEADGALVVIDTAPLLPVTDAAALSRSVDAVILVSRAKTSTKRQTRSALEVLRQVDAPIVGSVLNGLREEASGHYYRIGHRGRRWEFPRLGRNGSTATESAREGVA
jgi:capsular exopolysaccharide synthesis family protein